MKELIKYELYRSYRFYIGILASMISGLIITSIAILNKDYKLSGLIAFGSVLIFGVFLLQIERRTELMIKDLMADYKEHMLTIPVTDTNIVSIHYLFGIFEELIITLIVVIYVGITSKLSLHDGVEGFIYAVIFVFTIFSLNTIISTFAHRIFKNNLLTILIRIISWAIIIILLLIMPFNLNYYLLKENIPNKEAIFFCLFAVIVLIGYAINCKIIALNSNKQYRKIAGVILSIVIVICISVLLLNYCYRNVDNTNMAFENDTEVIGTWNTVDYVRDINSFDPNNESNDTLSFKGILINDNGLTSFYNWKWTKGYIINYSMHTTSAYKIKTINGSTYMFMQWKSGDYVYLNMKPYYYVLKKEE